MRISKNDPDYQRKYRLDPVNQENRRIYQRKRRLDPVLKERKRVYHRQYCGYPEPTHVCPEFCECCGKLPIGKQSLHLDHDHITGKFRGWLCNNCNLGIGKLGDSLEGLNKAMNYLKGNII
jgi:hypothetical protein